MKNKSARYLTSLSSSTALSQILSAYLSTQEMKLRTSDGVGVFEHDCAFLSERFCFRACGKAGL